MHSALRIVAFSSLLFSIPSRSNILFENMHPFVSARNYSARVERYFPKETSDFFSFLFFSFSPRRNGKKDKDKDTSGSIRGGGVEFPKRLGETFRKQGDASEKQLGISNLPANQTNPWFRTAKGWAKRRMDSNFVRFICETLPRVVGKHGRLGTSRTSCCASWLRAYASNRAEREALPSSLHEQFHFHPWKMYANHPSRQPWRKSQGTARDNEFAGLSDFLGTRSC